MKNPRGLVKGFGCRPVVSCETASNRDPLPKQHKALTSHAEFDQHGVPIGADRNPGEPYNSPSTVNTFALIYDGVPIGCRNTPPANSCKSLISPRYITCRCTMRPPATRVFSTTLQ